MISLMYSYHVEEGMEISSLQINISSIPPTLLCLFLGSIFVYSYSLNVFLRINLTSFSTDREVFGILKLFYFPLRETNLNAWVFQTLLLVILQLMHIYWSVYIMKVGVGIFKAGRYKNVYDNKENKID